MALNLVTFDDLKTLQDLQRDEGEYPSLGVIIPSVTAAIEGYLRRKLEAEERTETKRFGNNPTRFVDLPAIPVISISSVTVTDAGEDTSLEEDTDYYITISGIELLVPLRRCKLVVIYTGGYENEEYPEELHRAALLQTAYELSTKNQIGSETVSTEGGTITRPGTVLLPEVKRILDDFKHPAAL